MICAKHSCKLTFVLLGNYTKENEKWKLTILREELFKMMLMLIMKLLKRTLLKKVLPILRYILRRKILKGKFVENGLEREIK